MSGARGDQAVKRDAIPPGMPMKLGSWRPSDESAMQPRAVLETGLRQTPHGTARRGTFRITVLGNFSGRNAGDAAILGALINDVSRLYPHAEFIVPTTSPSFVRKNYPDRSVKPISLLPWTLNLKIFGLSALRAVLGCDLLLVT